MIPTAYIPFTSKLRALDEHIRTLFDKQLPKELFYHCADHTLDPIQGVVARTVEYSRMEGVPERDVELLAMAAYFHDAGFIERRQDNEILGAQLFTNYARDTGLFEHSIRKGSIAILDTRSTIPPSFHFGEILCDADLDNLGRHDFREKSELLRMELSIPASQEQAYLESTLEFLKEHPYHTPSAQKFREEGRLKNIARLENELYGGEK